MGFLAFGPQRVGGIGLDLISLLGFATMVMLGAQALGLAVVARSYAAHLGLLPPSRRLIEFLERYTVEHGLALGVASFLVGVALFVGALVSWGSTGFGALDIVSSARVPVFGMVFCVVGFQLLLISFAMSLTLIGEG
jgi:hypothetical protein